MAADLEGRIAVVTGAGSGIGRAVAVRLAEAGATVVASSRDESHLAGTCDEVAGATGKAPVAIVADLRDAWAPDRLVQQVVDAHGRIDVVSNNAGIDLVEGPLAEETTDEQWAMLMDVNVTGMMRICRAAIPHMGAGSSIINMGSVNSFVAWPNDVAYTTSKGAVLQFSRALALELAGRSIRVNCVCPGMIDTPLTDSFLAVAEDAAELRREYARYAPLERMGTPREVANCVLFLASDESAFVTGSALVVDGGATAR
jgi:NAD(P)-dependent dehydrogenase (short-subunit alcohol dehydrogenase family)